jgi:hypothetical protein
MRLLLLIALAAAGANHPLHTPANASSRATHQSRVQLNAQGDIVRFYGIPMDLTLAGLKRLPYHYKIGHYSAEGDTYTFYTITAKDGVVFDLGFDRGRLDWIRTSSPKMVGPRGVGIGSPLSAVKAAWPDGKLLYGVEEHEAFVTYDPEPGFMGMDYYFEPSDMPKEAFDSDYRKSRDIKVPDIRVSHFGYSPPRYPDDTFDRRSASANACAPRAGAESRASCARWSATYRYRGTALVGPDTAFFSPLGKPRCAEAQATELCMPLIGTGIDWLRPHSPTACPKLYKLEFLGRRDLLTAGPTYRIIPNYVLAYEELPAPPQGPRQCDKAL